MTQEFSTAQELQEEYYFQIAQTLGYENIEKIKCIKADEIIEKLHNCNNFETTNYSIVI